MREAQAGRSRRLEITADRVLLEIERLAFGDMRQVASWSPDGLVLIDSLELADEAAAGIVEIKETRNQSGTTLSVKRADKLKALELLARHLGLMDGPTAEDPGAAQADLRLVLRLALERAASSRRPRIIDGEAS